MAPKDRPPLHVLPFASPRRPLPPPSAPTVVRFPRSLGDKLQVMALTHPDRLIALELLVDELLRLPERDDEEA